MTSPTINALLALSDGNLAVLLSNKLSVNALNVATVFGAPTGGTAAQNLAVTLNSDGTFTGSFLHPVGSRTTSFGGAVLQKTQTTSGYFLGAPTSGSPLQSGAVTISAQ